MGVRPSKHWTILKKDIKNGSVKKKPYKDVLEYWIYRKEASKTLINLAGQPLRTGKMYLHAIIVAPKDHITLDNKEKDLYEIEGVRFTNDIEQGRDLDDYLSKTGRG